MQLQEHLHALLGQAAAVQEHAEQQDVACQALWLLLVNVQVQRRTMGQGGATRVPRVPAQGEQGVPDVVGGQLQGGAAARDSEVTSRGSRARGATLSAAKACMLARTRTHTPPHTCRMHTGGATAASLPCCGCTGCGWAALAATSSRSSAGLSPHSWCALSWSIGFSASAALPCAQGKLWDATV